MASKMTASQSTRPENVNSYRPQTAVNPKKDNTDEAYDWDCEEDSPNKKPKVKQAFGMPPQEKPKQNNQPVKK